MERAIKKLTNFDSVKNSTLLIILLLSLTSLIVPVSPAGAVNAENLSKKELKKAAKEERKMDTLSLVGYLSAVGGIASLFIVPLASLVLLPAAFVMGVIGLYRGKRYYQNTRGWGLSLAATILGGLFILVFTGSFLIFLLSF